MRVTKQALINDFLRNLNKANEGLFDINGKISSGKRVERPEDDAIAAAAITRLNAQIKETEQYQENIMQSLSELNTIDSTLNEVSSINMRVRELAVHAANDSMSPAERDAIAVEVNQLLESLVQLSNTTMGGKYLFSGHESVGAPFEIVRGSDIGEVNDIVTIDGELRKELNVNNITSVQYRGDDQTTSIEVDQGLAVADNITGHEIFYYDKKLNNSGPILGEKSVEINGKTELSSIVNAKNKEGISSGYMYVTNTRGLHVSGDTNPDDGIDNSTRLMELNHRRGIGRDQNGNVVTMGHIKVTDSVGTSMVIDTAALAGPPTLPAMDLTDSDATLEEVVSTLNWALDPNNPANTGNEPQLRFIIEGDGIKVVDNAGGTTSYKIEDFSGVDDGTWGVGVRRMSTFAQDLELSVGIQTKTIDSATTSVGAFNGFTGVNFRQLEEGLSGSLSFATGETLNILSLKPNDLKFQLDDGAGNVRNFRMESLPGDMSMQDLLDDVNTRFGTTLAYGNLNGGASSFTVTHTDGTTDNISVLDLQITPQQTVSFENIPLMSGGAYTMDELMVNIASRTSVNQMDGNFTIILSDGSRHVMNMGKTSLTQNSSLDDVISELNRQTTRVLAGGGALAVPQNYFQLSGDGQRIEINDAQWNANFGATVEKVVDLNDGTAAFDLGIDAPQLSANFPGVASENKEYPGLIFDEGTLLSSWAKDDVSQFTNGSMRLVDASGQETFINMSALNDPKATVKDLLELVNGSGSKVEAQISPSGYGLRFIDNSSGSGKFFVEDYGNSKLVEKLNIQTPINGAEKEFDTGAGVLVDLTSIGSSIKTVDDLLAHVNQTVARIGVEASVDPREGRLVFTDTRAPHQKGSYSVRVEDAIGLQSKLETLNDGGGVNTYKMRVIDSKGVAQNFDLRDANTIEDVVNILNTQQEKVDEKTPIKEFEGVTMPLGTIQVSSTVGAANIDLSVLDESSTIQDMLGVMKTQLTPVQIAVDLKIDEESGGLRFQFQDLKAADGSGSISIQDVAGTSGEQMKFTAVAEGSPFATGLMVHKRVDIRAEMNSARNGLRIVDGSGGELKITEVEGRTTAHDLGLIPKGSGAAVSVDGQIIGGDLEAYKKPAEELGLATGLSTIVTSYDDGISSLESLGGMENKFTAIQSTRLFTKSMQTLKGKVDLDPKTNLKTKLGLLNNSIPNSQYTGNQLKGIDDTGIITIETLNDDGSNANYEEIQIDFRALPDNATVDDLQALINAQIAADDQFQADIELGVTTDGELKFNSNIPIRISMDTSVDLSAGSHTMNDLFGVNQTDFALTHTTNDIGLDSEYTGGVDLENFFIKDSRTLASLEIDLNRIAADKHAFKRDLELEDIKDFIEYNSRKPTEVKTTTNLVELGVEFPLNIPAAGAVEVNSFTPFNNLTTSSTVQDFMDCFTVATVPPSIFNDPANTNGDGAHQVQIQIADATNSSPADFGKKLVVIDQEPAGAGTPSFPIHGIPKELNEVFSKLGIQLGGTTTALPGGVQGITGAQISGLGYDVKMEIDDQGYIQLESLEKDNLGRLEVLEGQGTTATDLKLVTGTGAIGNGTERVKSGNVNPGLDRNALLGELSPKNDGYSTSFVEQLKNLYIENGADQGEIQLLENPPVTMETPIKAFNKGAYDPTSEVFNGGVDVGRPGSGFVIEDQFGNKAVVDLSNDLSRFSSTTVAGLTASASGTGTRFTGAANDFSGFKVGDFFEIEEDRDLDGTGQRQSRREKYEIVNVAADGSWVEFAEPVASFDTSAANYSVNLFGSTQDLFAKMETEYVDKPFYSGESTLRDLQSAIDIAIDKAKRTTGFGVDKIVLNPSTSGGFQMEVFGSNGPTVVITERDINEDGVPESSTASDLALLRESGARGNGSPLVESGNIDVSPTVAYMLDTINQSLSGANVTASIGADKTGVSLDLTSNTNSTYIKARDSLEGNTASQTGMTSTRSLFQTLIDFRDSLYRNDADYIANDMLKRITEDEEKVLQYRAQIGSVVNRFETNNSRLETTNVQLVTRLSENQDIEVSEAIIELRQLELAQKAALSVGSRIVQQTLLDFIR
jgi:flagellar hook-associated protein 3 FlgL